LKIGLVWIEVKLIDLDACREERIHSRVGGSVIRSSWSEVRDLMDGYK